MQKMMKVKSTLFCLKLWLSFGHKPAKAGAPRNETQSDIVETESQAAGNHVQKKTKQGDLLHEKPVVSVGDKWRRTTANKPLPGKLPDIF